MTAARAAVASVASMRAASANGQVAMVAPVAAKQDAEHSFPYEVVDGMAEMGLFGLPFPEEYGGMGGDYFALCLALEELGKVDQSVAITLEAGVSLGAMPVYRFGTEAQKQEWLPMLTSGKALGAFGLTGALVLAAVLSGALLAGLWIVWRKARRPFDADAPPSIGSVAIGADAERKIDQRPDR